MKEWLKHAFHVEPPGPAEPTDAQAEVVDWICRQVVKRHLTTPALLAMEMSRPLNFIGAQAMRFFQPLMSALLSHHGHEGYSQFAAYLERRGSLEYLCGRIEALEAEAVRKERARAATASDESQTPIKEHDEAD